MTKDLITYLATGVVDTLDESVKMGGGNPLVESEAEDYGTSDGVKKAWLKRHAHLSPQDRSAAWEKQTREDLADLDADADDLNTSMAKYHRHLLARGKHSTDEEERENSDAMNSLRKKLSQRGISINNYGPGALFTYRGKSGLTHDLEGWQCVSSDKVNATAKDEAVEKYNQLVAESEAEDRSSIHPAFKPFKPKHADGTPCNAANPATCPKNPLNIAKKQEDQAQMYRNQMDNRLMNQWRNDGYSEKAIQNWKHNGGPTPDEE